MSLCQRICFCNSGPKMLPIVFKHFQAILIAILWFGKEECCPSSLTNFLGNLNLQCLGSTQGKLLPCFYSEIVVRGIPLLQFCRKCWPFYAQWFFVHLTFALSNLNKVEMLPIFLLKMFRCFFIVICEVTSPQKLLDVRSFVLR